MTAVHSFARRCLAVVMLLGFLLPLQALPAAAAAAGPARLVTPAQPAHGRADTPSGARHGHPGRVVFHRTRNQRRAASTANVNTADNMTYHNGPTERAQSASYAIFWQPRGTYMSSGYQTLLERYFGDVGGSPLYNVATQYYDTGGSIVNSSSYAGAWLDTSPYPSSTLTDADLQNEVLNAVNTNNWPWYNPDAEFFVFTARGENSCYGSSCSFTQFCAYHSNFAATNGVTTSNVLYANMPYAGTNLSACGAPSSPNNNIDADSAINLVSHEQMETVTDPLGSAWYDSVGSEIGDKCAWTFGATNGNGADATWNGNPYIVQQEWSNATASCVVSYGATLAVTGLSPTSGPTAGGTTVTVNGSGFTGATGVHFGSVAATNVTVKSSSQITATAPGENAGTVDVTVTTPSGTSPTTTADRYTYINPQQPTVSSLSPSAGPATGGTTVTITGTNFATGATVAFGTAAASSVAVASPTTITATAPAGSGVVDVTVTTANGSSATSSADKYTYDPQPTVSSVNPAAGPLAGGTVVTISGSGFVAGATVQFGTVAATTVSLVSSSQLTATAPAQNAAGGVDVTVTTVGGTSATGSGDTFTYLAAPTVTAIAPPSGASGTSVTITGTNFANGATVAFGSVAAGSVAVASPTKITATAPAGSGAVDVTVTTAGGTSATSNADTFTYTAPTFTLNATPTAQTVGLSSRTSYRLTLTAVNGFNSAVHLSVSGLPRWTSAGFSANPVTPTTSGAASTLTVSTRWWSQRGTFTLTVTASGNGVTQTLPLQLTVQ